MVRVCWKYDPFWRTAGLAARIQQITQIRLAFNSSEVVPRKVAIFLQIGISDVAFIPYSSKLDFCGRAQPSFNSVLAHLGVWVWINNTFNYQRFINNRVTFLTLVLEIFRYWVVPVVNIWPSFLVARDCTYLSYFASPVRLIWREELFISRFDSQYFSL